MPTQSPVIRTAMILAAGYATRLRPISTHMPKAMVPILGKPILGYILDRLKEINLEELVINSHHLADHLHQYLARQTGIKITLSEEKEILETGGGIKQALPLLGNQPFYVINGKIIWFNTSHNTLQHLAEQWDDNKMDVLLLLQPAIKAVGYHAAGDFHLFADGTVRRREDGEVAPFVFSGIQIIHPRLFDRSPTGKFSLNVLYDQAIANRRLYAVRHDGEWLHVSTPQDIREVENYLKATHRNG